jgi:hypothetical protein
MVLKIPPPPTLAGQFQQLNRWLLEIQNILNTQGTIDPSQVDGLPALIVQVATLATQVATLITEVATNTTDIATNTANITTNTTNIAANTTNIAANTASIVTLTARNQILNGAGAPGVGTGNSGDLYINNSGSPGAYLYGKIGGAWIAFA